jgi:hypothetical protein
MKYIILFLAVAVTSCNWAKEKTKETVNKTGEAIGKAGSEFAQGVAKGVETTFSNEVKFSEQLTKLGLKSGKVTISSTDSARDNKLTVYLIFDNNIDQKITAKIFDENGQEYGRVRQQIKGEKGDAHYVDFIFDNRTNIDSKGTIQFE